jgi:hypothetical protein
MKKPKRRFRKYYGPRWKSAMQLVDLFPGLYSHQRAMIDFLTQGNKRLHIPFPARRMGKTFIGIDLASGPDKSAEVTIEKLDTGETVIREIKTLDIVSRNDPLTELP